MEEPLKNLALDLDAGKVDEVIERLKTLDPARAQAVQQSIEFLKDTQTYKAIYGFGNRAHPTLPPEASAFEVCERFQLICDWIQFYSKKSVLDVGSSNGILIGKLINDRIVSRAVGVELGTTLCDVAAEVIKLHNLTNIQIVNSMFEEFSTDEKFDVAIFGEILEHVINPVACLQKTYGLLKNDGLLIITVPTGTPPGNPEEQAQTFDKPIHQHVRYLDGIRLRTLALDSGFVPIYYKELQSSGWTWLLGIFVKFPPETIN
jgi:2-polyprenyl-3-methyl-5-hydroxy-6-metoxy-1,4-benzoquinol methylase